MTASDDETTSGAPTAPARPGLRCVVAALAGAAATGLATPPVGLAWLQWPALALLARALDGLPLRRALLVGACAGLGINLSLFTWLGIAAARLGDLGAPAAAALFAVWATFASLQFALVAGLDAGVRALAPRARRLLLPCAFVAADLLWPQVTPWSVGIAQAGTPLAQVAELGGAPLVTFVVVTGAVGLEALVAARRPGPARADAAWAAAVVGAALVFGLVRPGTLPAGEPVRVAIVQPGVVSNRLTPRAPEEVQAALERLAAEVGASGAALAVFPESAAARPLLEVDATDAAARPRLEAEATLGREELARLARLCGCPTLIGVTALRVTPGDTVEASRIVERRNALVLLGADGAIVDRYDKHALLPLAERLPLEGALPWLRRLVPLAGRFTPGPGPRRLSAGSLEVAPLICYEAVPGGPTRAALAQGDVDLLVNATNDVWFPPQGQHLHALAASLRAVEARRPLVRATTTGLSFVALPDGARAAEAPAGASALRVVDLPRARGVTPVHVVGGWLFGPVASLVLGAALVTGAARRRITPSPS
ncbi:MAG: apolipoprotein N-acyltransferase [Planctomycetes bacterium]|nr:apolipoprotein N-acyltransferase [Planctomycetota bacterium]